MKYNFSVATNDIDDSVNGLKLCVGPAADMPAPPKVTVTTVAGFESRANSLNKTFNYECDRNALKKQFGEAPPRKLDSWSIFLLIALFLPFVLKVVLTNMASATLDMFDPLARHRGQYETLPAVVETGIFSNILTSVAARFAGLGASLRALFGDTDIDTHDLEVIQCFLRCSHALRFVVWNFLGLLFIISITISLVASSVEQNDQQDISDVDIAASGALALFFVLVIGFIIRFKRLPAKSRRSSVPL
eukprot:c16265_g1_i2.p1 GENE.c16265_g1_i2~~c16265_g1_i2.p1  ORF type:complete len:247 (+),score=47.23 c16265_g1_i2:356-1096(+)